MLMAAAIAGVWAEAVEVSEIFDLVPEKLTARYMKRNAAGKH
jgi:hypothetical protein